jgi:hypothetical protein
MLGVAYTRLSIAGRDPPLSRPGPGPGLRNPALWFGRATHDRCILGRSHASGRTRSSQGLKCFETNGHRNWGPQIPWPAIRWTRYPEHVRLRLSEAHEELDMEMNAGVVEEEGWVVKLSSLGLLFLRCIVPAARRGGGFPQVPILHSAHGTRTRGNWKMRCGTIWNQLSPATNRKPTEEHCRGGCISKCSGSMTGKISKENAP